VCTKTLSCGHLCGGIFGEEACLPCLHQCRLEDRELLKQDADDMCMICFTEALSAAPAILVCHLASVVDYVWWCYVNCVVRLAHAVFSLTHKFVRFGACFRQMTRKMNLHCDTLDAHNACQNELIHRHILLSPITFIFVSSSNCCKKYQYASVRRSIL